jgi:hypothetical protein
MSSRSKLSNGGKDTEDQLARRRGRVDRRALARE